MVRVHFYGPDEPIPPLAPVDENALSFSRLTRADLLRQVLRDAPEEPAHLFIAEEDGTCVAQGITEVRRVISVDNKSGAIRLSESHASHRSLQPLEVGHSYELAIDPASNKILRAEDLGEQALPEPATDRYMIHPCKDLEDLGRIAVAEAFFARMQRQPHIPFEYPGNGCQARAHEMCRLIEGYLHRDPSDVVAKVWNIAVQETDFLVRTDNVPGCSVRWFFHVAPVVKAEDQLLVIDPSLFGQPVTVETWISKPEGESTGPVYTTRAAYNWKTGELFTAEKTNATKKDLQRFHDNLFDQIYCHGPLPYPCAQRHPPFEGDGR